MKKSKLPLIIGASALGLIALIGFQVNWMTQSRKLIEEQFDQKARMALCMAIEDMAPKSNFDSLRESCSADIYSPQKCGVQLDSMIQTKEVEAVLNDAFSFYGIDLDYDVHIIDPIFDPFAGASPYSCSLKPITLNNDHIIRIDFPGKSKYIFGKMNFMMISSIFILLFITLVFFMINYNFFQQKRISEQNKDFFNNMAHEFRTPLTNISLAANLFLKKEENIQHQQYLGIVKREAKQLMGQVDRILYLSKLENGDYRLQIEEVHLGDLLRRVISDMDIQIKAKQAKIVLKEGCVDPIILGDSFHLGNAFRNLIDNALKYNEKDPEITIAIDRSSKGIELLFQDNGIGIGKGEQEYIFKKFYRTSTGNQHPYKGFGLGLAYVKRIVELHQGIIHIFSELHKGSRFDLIFPTN